MSLEGGSEDFNAANAIGGCCPSCYSPVPSLELDGYCATCAGVHAPPARTRADFLRGEHRTFELAAAKTTSAFNRRAYRVRLDRIEAELAELEAAERG